MNKLHAMDARGWGLILILSLLWGSAFYLNEIGLRGFPPNTLVLARMGGAALILLAFVWATGRRLPTDRAAWTQLSILGFLNVVLPFILFTWGQTQIDSGLASVLNATTPLWGVIAAHFLTKDEKATPLRLGGVIIGVAGVIVMIGGDAFGGIGGSVIAQLACLAATLCYALATIYSRRIGTAGLDPMTLATGQVVSAAIMMIPIALVTDRPWALPAPNMDVIGASLALALLSTSLAYILFFRLVALAGATNAMLVTFLMPVVAIALGTVMLDETLTINQIAGIFLIAFGLIALDGRLVPRLAARTNVP